MSIKEEIRNYQSKEEVEKDYERYKEEWRYNVEEESGVHKTGIGLRKVYYEGLTDGEIGAYLRMLKNQFIVMNEMNPHEEREPTEEERKKDFEDWRKRHTAFVIKGARYNGKSEEEIKQIVIDLNKVFDREFKEKFGGR